MVHTTRLRVKGIESSRRTRYILPRTRKAPCANLLLLPLTETLRTNNDDDDNDNVETHTGGTVHAARCLSSPPHARSLASSTSLFVSPRHHETRKQTTAVEDASCLQESSTLFHWAELVVVAGEKGDTEGERGTHIHTVARARVPTGGNERKREGEREKERETARQNDTIRLRRRSDSNWAPSGWSRPTSADSAEPRRSPIARSFPPSLPIPPIPNPSRRPSLLVLASQPPPSCLLLFPLTNSRPSFLAALSSLVRTFGLAFPLFPLSNKLDVVPHRSLPPRLTKVSDTPVTYRNLLVILNSWTTACSTIIPCTRIR